MVAVALRFSGTMISGVPNPVVLGGVTPALDPVGPHGAPVRGLTRPVRVSGEVVGREPSVLGAVLGVVPWSWLGAVLLPL